MKGRWVYLSHFYNEETPGYGGKKDFSIDHTRCIDHGDKCNQFDFTMSNHVGTHCDFPYHFDKSGKKLSDYQVTDFIFTNVEIVNVEVKEGELIYCHHLNKINPCVDFLILNSDFEKNRKEEIYWNNNPGLSAELASFLKANYKNLRAIGVDFISATSYNHKEEGRMAHLAFLGNINGEPIIIVEDMSLCRIRNSKVKQIIMSPLLISDADGVPVTILAELG